MTSMCACLLVWEEDLPLHFFQFQVNYWRFRTRGKTDVSDVVLGELCFLILRRAPYDIVGNTF